MDFFEWDQAVRAAVFGAIFLATLFGVLWIWYDGSGSADVNRWFWRMAGALLVLLTIPAVVLGSANLDSEREQLFTTFAWMGIGGGLVALLTVPGYGLFGRPQRLNYGGDFGGGFGPGGDDPTEFRAGFEGGAGGFDSMTQRGMGFDPLTQPAGGGFAPGAGGGFSPGFDPPTMPAGDDQPTRKQSPRKEKADAFFVAKSGNDKGKQFPIPNDRPVVIGRNGSKADIELNDVRVSRKHAQVKRAGGAYSFIDLESANGSFLMVEGRSEEIRTPQRLVHGDEVRVGHTVLTFIDTQAGGDR